MRRTRRLAALLAAVACVALSVPAAASEPFQDDITNHGTSRVTTSGP